MGLAIVHRIVTDHAGTIRVEDNRPRGSVFRIELPLGGRSGGVSGPALLVGTAGHVDHGKTALLAALTGIDCDRLPEEKRRGITLDLGFAHLERDGVEIGFVDVPGHERFLDNALAGLGGIRLLLLVVAADEGVRPQTREHLEIAELLGIPRGDRGADQARRSPATSSPTWSSSRSASCSSRPASAARRSCAPRASPAAASTRSPTRLFERARAARRGRRLAGPARLPIDRAFLLQGRGLVVTGTLARGAVAAGDELEQLPAGRRVRVRAVHVHGRAREAAAAGEPRPRSQVAGLELGQVERGDELVAPGRYLVTRRLLGAPALAARGAVALEGRLELRVHLFAAERVAVARPLAPGAARARRGGAGRAAPGAAAGRRARRPADRAPAVARGDARRRRRARPPLPQAARRRARRRARRARRRRRGRARSSGSTRAPRPAPPRPTSRAGSAARPPRSRRRLATLAAGGRVVAGPESSAGRRWFAPGAARGARAARSRAARRLLRPRAAGDRHAARRGGHAPAAAPRRRARRLPPRLARRAQGARARRRPAAAPRPRAPCCPSEETGLSAAILERYDRAGLEAPSPGEVARELAAKPEIVDGLVRHLVARKRLLRLPAGLVLAAAAVDRMVAELRAAGHRALHGRPVQGALRSHPQVGDSAARAPRLDRGHPAGRGRTDAAGAPRRAGAGRSVIFFDSAIRLLLALSSPAGDSHGLSPGRIQGLESPISRLDRPCRSAILRRLEYSDVDCPTPVLSSQFTRRAGIRSSGTNWHGLRLSHPDS